MNKNRVNWKSVGFLEGLSDKQAKIVTKYFNQVKIEKLNDNEDAETAIYPVIRYIINHIINSKDTDSPSYIYYYLQKPHVINGVDELLGYVDVNEITEQLLKYYTKFVPLAEEYLPNIDAHDEMTVLFCTDYLFKIINKAKQ